jgi:hypothetical protein
MFLVAFLFMQSELWAKEAKIDQGVARAIRMDMKTCQSELYSLQKELLINNYPFKTSIQNAIFLNDSIKSALKKIHSIRQLAMRVEHARDQNDSTLAMEWIEIILNIDDLLIQDITYIEQEMVGMMRCTSSGINSLYRPMLLQLIQWHISKKGDRLYLENIAKMPEFLPKE